MEYTERESTVIDLPKVIARWSTNALLGIVGLIIIFGSFRIVPSGSRGLYFRLGAVHEKVLGEGVHLKLPIIDKIKKISIRPIELEYRVEVDSSGAITKDNQTVGADMNIFYTYAPDKLVDMWRTYGQDKMEDILSATLKETFKEVIGEYTIFNIAVSQDEIRGKVTEKLKEKLASYPISLNEVKIVNYDWSDSFDKQIATTMERAQQVKQAEQDLLITEQQAQKQVKEAEAAKQATITQAEGEKAAAQLRAEAKALEGDGIRKYNEAVARNIDIEIKLRQLEIEKARVEKWNGEYVPVQNYSPIPFSQGSLQGR